MCRFTISAPSRYNRQLSNLTNTAVRGLRTNPAEFPEPIAQQPVAQLPWGHITVLLDRLSDTADRTW